MARTSKIETKKRPLQQPLNQHSSRRQKKFRHPAFLIWPVRLCEPRPSRSCPSHRTKVQRLVRENRNAEDLQKRAPHPWLRDLQNNSLDTFDDYLATVLKVPKKPFITVRRSVGPLHTTKRDGKRGRSASDPNMSTSSGSPESWISSFCSLLGHEYFAEVSEEFIEDDFNLTGLQNQVAMYKEALEVSCRIYPRLTNPADPCHR